MYRIRKGVVFCDPLDRATEAQFKECLRPDWSIKGALMPDAHLGYGLPIGGVVKTDRIVVPSWVG
jgi:tRNA-splicing ligase RtcB